MGKNQPTEMGAMGSSPGCNLEHTGWLSITRSPSSPLGCLEVKKKWNLVARRTFYPVREHQNTTRAHGEAQPGMAELLMLLSPRSPTRPPAPSPGRSSPDVQLHISCGSMPWASTYHQVGIKLPVGRVMALSAIFSAPHGWPFPNR